MALDGCGRGPIITPSRFGPSGPLRAASGCRLSWLEYGLSRRGVAGSSPVNRATAAPLSPGGKRPAEKAECRGVGLSWLEYRPVLFFNVRPGGPRVRAPVNRAIPFPPIFAPDARLRRICVWPRAVTRDRRTHGLIPVCIGQTDHRLRAVPGFAPARAARQTDRTPSPSGDRAPGCAVRPVRTG